MEERQLAAFERIADAVERLDPGETDPAAERIADALERLTPGENDARAFRQRIRMIVRRYWRVIEKANEHWREETVAQVAAAYDTSIARLEERVCAIERDLEIAELKADDERAERSERDD